MLSIIALRKKIENIKNQYLGMHHIVNWLPVP